MDSSPRSYYLLRRAARGKEFGLQDVAMLRFKSQTWPYLDRRPGLEEELGVDITPDIRHVNQIDQPPVLKDYYLIVKTISYGPPGYILRCRNSAVQCCEM